MVYIYYFAQWPFEYYYRGPLQRLCIGKSCVETGLQPNTAGAAPERVWLIASHIPPLKDMREFAAKLLGPEWRETACYQGEGAVLFCFQGSEAWETLIAEAVPIKAWSSGWSSTRRKGLQIIP